MDDTHFELVLDNQPPVHWNWRKALAVVAVVLALPALVLLGFWVDNGWLVVGALAWVVGWVTWASRWAKRRHRQFRQPVGISIRPDALVVLDHISGTETRFPFAHITRHRYEVRGSKSGRWQLLTLHLTDGTRHTLTNYYELNAAYPQFRQLVYALELALHGARHPSQPRPPAPLVPFLHTPMATVVLAGLAVALGWELWPVAGQPYRPGFDKLAAIGLVGYYAWRWYRARAARRPPG